MPTNLDSKLIQNELNQCRRTVIERLETRSFPASYFLSIVANSQSAPSLHTSKPDAFTDTKTSQIHGMAP